MASANDGADSGYRESQASLTGGERAFHSLKEWGEPDGDAFGVVAELESTGALPGLAPLNLPETIYGAAVAVMLLLPDEIPMAFRIGFLGPVLGASLLCLGLQAYMAWIVQELVSSNEDPDEIKCLGGDFVLRIICLMVFLVLMMNSFKSSCDTHRWVSRMPTCAHHQMLRMQKFIDLSPVPDDYKKFGYDHLHVTKVVTGLTILERGLIYTLMGLKCIIELYLVYHGSAYILHSDSQEGLITRAVALVFVVEIPDYLFLYVTNRTVYTCLEAMPMVGITWAEAVSWLIKLDDAWLVLSFPFLLMNSAILYKAWC